MESAALFPRATRGAAALLCLAGLVGWPLAAPGVCHATLDERFAGPFTPLVGAEAYRGAGGDFNEDGHDDVLLASPGVHGLTRWLSRANGGLGLADSVALGLDPLLIVTGDWDADGHLDLALGPVDSAQVWLFYGDGRGAFGRAASIAGEAAPRSLVTGDFDGDGQVDLALAGYDSTRIAFHRGLEDGGFAPGRFVPVPGKVGGLAAGRIDGDAIDDLLVMVLTDTSDCVGVVSGRAGDVPRFSACLVSSRGRTEFNRFSLAVHDLNSDGWSDLVYGTTYTMYIRLARGDGTFDSASEVGLDGAPTAWLAIFDATDDGVPDLLLPEYDDNRLIIRPGDGGGGFGAPLEFATTPGPASVLSGEFTGDAHDDLVVVGRVSVQTLLAGQGGAAYGGGLFVPMARDPNRLRVADLDGDQHLDIVAGTGDFYDAGELVVYRGRGDGTLFPPVVTAPGHAMSDFVVGDFDGDGRPDVAAVSREADRLLLLVGVGDGTFRAAGEWPVAGRPHGLAAADFDGDGWLDVASVQESAGTVQLFHNAGRGVLTATPPIRVGTAPGEPEVGEFTGDGHPDLVVANLESASLSLLAGGADGRLQAPRTIRTWSFPIGIAATDIDGDCLTDLVVNYRRTSRTTFLVGRGDGTFAEGVDQRASAQVQKTSYADLNGDGRVDRIQALPELGVIAYALRGYPEGYIDPVLVGTGTYPTEVTTGDFDHNILADLVVRRIDRGGFTLLLNRPPGGPIFGEPGPAWVKLLGAWPNPTRTGSAIRFQAEPGERARVELFDVLGRRVRHLDVRYTAGIDRCYAWDGRDDSGHLCPSGHYLIRIGVRGQVTTGRLVVAR